MGGRAALVIFSGKMPISKKEFSALIDAYADAKVSKNPVLMNMMVSQMERAIDLLFAEEEKENTVPTEQY